MSRIYKIHSTRVFPLVEMVNRMSELQMFRPLCGRFYHPTYYFYNFGSLRGIDVTAEKGIIEIRTTILSNHHDHQMAGFMIKHLKDLTDGILTDEEDDEINPHFYDGNIYEWIEEDLEVLRTVLKKGSEVRLFGPFGAYDLNDEDVAAILESNETAYSKMYRLEELLRQPYQDHFEKIRTA